MKGRKRKPDELKILEGDKHTDRINHNRPKPPTERPTCPKHLSKKAKKEWRRVIAGLEAQGLVTKLDRAMLAAYCQAYGRWEEAEEMITQTGSLIYQTGVTTKTVQKKNGDVETTKKGGYPIISPYVSVANKAMEQMHKFGVEFGMSPASRTRIDTGKGGGEDDLLEQLFQECAAEHRGR